MRSSSKPKRVIGGILTVSAVFVLLQSSNAFESPSTRDRTPSHGFVIDHWQTEQGLPDNTVLSIQQSSDGFLWLATWVGLVRFDGAQFEVVGHRGSQRLRSQRIITIHEDAHGALWIGSDGGGLARVHRGKIDNYTTAEGLPSNSVSTLCSTPDGSIWVGAGATLSRLKDGRFTVFHPPEGDDLEHVSDIGADPSGRVWIATRRGVFRWENEVIRRIPLAPDLDGALMMTLHCSRSGRVWMGGETSGLMYWENGRLHRMSDFPQTGVWRIMETTSGDLWIGTFEGLRLYRDGAFTAITSENGLSSDSVRSLALDHEGNLWVGTGGGGINRVKPRRLASYTAGQPRVVAAIHEDQSGTVRIGVDCGGTYRWREGQLEREFVSLWDDLQFNSCIWSMAETPDGSFWIATWGGGLARLRNGETRIFGSTNGFTHAVQTLLAGRQGQLWIGTYDAGLYRFENEALLPEHPHPDRPIPDISSLVEDRSGGLWIGSSTDGIWRLDKGQWRHFGAADGIPSGAVIRTLQQDRWGTIWAGTAGSGMLQWTENGFRALTKENGLPHNVLGPCLQDAHGNLWWGSNAGIFRLTPQDIEILNTGARVDPLTLGRADGMPAIQCTVGAMISRDGRLWFGTTKGLVMIDPSEFPVNQIAPPVRIERVLGNDQIIWREEEGKAAINIPPGTDRIEIHYAGLSFSQPEKVRFKYQLAGLDRAWVDAENRRVAYYTLLAPGNYSFRLIACNNDGIWNREGVALSVIAHPQVWQTWWFRSLLLALMALIAARVYQSRISALEKERNAQRRFSRQLIESQELERKRIAGELHDSLEQNLLVIKNQALLALDRLDARSSVEESIREISEIAGAAVEETRAIAHNLRPYQLDRLGLTRALKSMVRSAAEAAAIEYELAVENLDNIFSREFEINIYRIVQESLNNIVKHARASRITVAAHPQGRRIRIAIHDNGLGFQPPPIPSSEIGGAGFGLAGIAERVKIMSGEFRIDTAPGKGARLEIMLPAI